RRTQTLGRAGSTLNVRYRVDPGLGVDEDELNRKIRRFAPVADTRSRETNPVFAEPTGRITVPVLTLHETGDAFVPFSLEQSYRPRTLAVGTSHLLVQRAIRWPAHCASTVTCASRPSTTSWPGSSAASNPTETMCWRPTCRSWACDGPRS